MAKLTGADKEAIQRDKSSLSTKQLTEKYGYSRSTIQRIKQDLEARVAEFKSEAPQDTVKERIMEDYVKAFDKPAQVQVPMLPQRDRQPIIQKIIMNIETFPTHFPSIEKSSFTASLSEKSPSQLDDILKTMEQTRTTNNLSAQMKQVFLVSARAAEVLGSRIRLKTQGFADALLQQQQELDYIFKELAINYADKFNQASSPELRLVMLCGMTMLQVDSRNRVKEVMEKREENYTDL